MEFSAWSYLLPYLVSAETVRKKKYRIYGNSLQITRTCVTIAARQIQNTYQPQMTTYSHTIIDPVFISCILN